MKIQDLKVVYICPDHNEKYHTRKLHMDTMLAELGFKDVIHHTSGTEAYPLCLSKATVDILTEHMNTPVLILEDDIEFTGIDEFDFVDDADAIYFGASRCAGHPSENMDQGIVQFEPYSSTQVRIKNMLSAHAILYISEAYKRSVIELLTHCTIYNDVALSRIQSSFKVLANIHPSFYQSAKFNNNDSREELYTNIQLVHTGLHLIATNKYIEFLDKMIESVDKCFFPKTLRHVIIYTNIPNLDNVYSKYPTIQVHVIMIVHEPWPYVTLKRFHSFSLSQVPLDYSFYCDVDAVMLHITPYTMLTDRLFGTIHPGWAGGKGTVCTDPASTAYIPEGKNEVYYCGGFFGGPHSKFMELTLELKNRIQSDMDKNVMAEFHDESHLNWYFWKHPPIVLNYPFAVEEGARTNKETCVIFLNKVIRGGYKLFRDPPSPPRVRLKLSSSGFRRY